jgi:hypothetical protein
VVEWLINLGVCRQRAVSCLPRLMAVELKSKLNQKVVPLSVHTGGACSRPCKKNPENTLTARTLKCMQVSDLNIEKAEETSAPTFNYIFVCSECTTILLDMEVFQRSRTVSSLSKQTIRSCRIWLTLNKNAVCSVVVTSELFRAFSFHYSAHISVIIG